MAANVLEHGTGALNVDGTRIGTDGRPGRKQLPSDTESVFGQGRGRAGFAVGDTTLGRWPANVLLDPEAAALLDEQSGERPSATPYRRNVDGGTDFYPNRPMGAEAVNGYGDSGGASRFFYTAKVSRAERERGVRDYGDTDRNGHPTVKPVDLMQWLCRLVTPPGGLVLDPFTGSGSTGIAALREGFDFLGIEREAEYVEIARARIIGDSPLFNVEGVMSKQTGTDPTPPRRLKDGGAK